tara:strand:+ start:241 stop:1365 length:1125 start_codon:yes stop_codon:yes gene_type:complete
MDSSQNIIIRVDSSTDIGSGHVIRCMNLARELKKRDFNVIFVCRDHIGNLTQYIQKEFKTIILERKSKLVDLQANIYEHWLIVSNEQDAIDTFRGFDELFLKSIQWIVIDHYGIDYRWQKKFNNLLIGIKNIILPKFLIIDDLFLDIPFGDVIVNQIYYREKSSYLHSASNNINILSGPKYALLAPEYLNMRQKCIIRKEVSVITVYFGGVDKFNYTLEVIKVLSNYKYNKLRINVIIGIQSIHANILKNFCEGKSNFFIYENLSNLASIFANSDLFIGAGGATTWERSCLGLPGLIVPISDNQILPNEQLALYLDCQNIIINKNLISTELQVSMDSLLQDKELLSSISRKLFSLVDGHGINRIVSLMQDINHE